MKEEDFKEKYKFSWTTKIVDGRYKNPWKDHNIAVNSFLIL